VHDEHHGHAITLGVGEGALEGFPGDVVAEPMRVGGRGACVGGCLLLGGATRQREHATQAESDSKHRPRTISRPEPITALGGPLAKAVAHLRDGPRDGSPILPPLDVARGLN